MDEQYETGGWVVTTRERKPRPWPLAWTISWCAMAFLFGALAGYKADGLDVAGRLYDWIEGAPCRGE